MQSCARHSSITTIFDSAKRAGPAPIQTAMIMAAGLGTRLRPFTDHTPKALLPLMGVPLAQFCTDGLAAAGVTRVVANVHHLVDRAVQGLQALDWSGMKLEISDERAQILGSAGGLAHARHLLGQSPFFVANADVLADLDWSSLAYRHMALRRQWGVKVTLAVFEKATVAGRYTEIQCDHSRGLITGLAPSAQGRPLYVGAAVIEPEALAGLNPDAPSEFVPQILEPAIREQKAGVYFSRGLWLDIGSPELWAESHFILMSRLESGDLRGPASSLWRQRLERMNARASRGVWMSRRSRVTVSPDWGESIYIDGLGGSGAVGSRTVAYGSSERSLQNGVFYHGLRWPS